MIELSACIELIFAEDPPHAFHDRVLRAADAGLGAVEMWGWRSKDLPALSHALRRSDLALTSMTVDPMIPLVDPERHSAALGAISESASVAADLGCEVLVVVGGDSRVGVSRAAHHRAVVAVLAAAAPIAEAHGVCLALENLNSRVDHVGHYLDSASEAMDIVDQVGSPAVRMLYDLYHSVVMGESPRSALRGRLDRVRHVQVADVPGRHEPGTGTIDWARELGWLWANGYRGRIGLEYVPTTPSDVSLRFIGSVLDAVPTHHSGSSKGVSPAAP